VIVLLFIVEAIGVLFDVVDAIDRLARRLHR